MWPSIRRLRDWAMLEPAGPQGLGHGAVHVSAEMAGLLLDNQPVPWNAEAVIVEAGLRLPPAARRREDFSIALPGREPIRAEALRLDEVGDRHRVFFRFVPPSMAEIATIHFRDRPLGHADISILSRDTFLDSLRLQLPTLHARIAGDSVACQTFIPAQCSGLQADALLTAPTSLAPLAEVGVHVVVRGAGDVILTEVGIPLSASQLSGRQALISAHPRKLPKRSGQWTIAWRVGNRELAAVRARAIPPGAVHRSLRVVGMRFAIDDGVAKSLRRQPPPPDDVVAFGPCFFVASAEAGMAARVKFDVFAVGHDEPAPSWPVEVLVTDGPTLVMPGMIAADQLARVQAFELRLRGRLLGTLPLHPVPAAKFTAEGGFVPPRDFVWSPAADEELSERLTKLMRG